MVKKLILINLVSFILANLYSDDTQIKLIASKYDVAIDEPFSFTLTITNDTGKIEIEQLPQLDPAIINIDSQQGQKINIISTIDGFQKKVTYFYKYTCKIIKTGEYQIGPFVIKSNNKTYNSDIIKIKVIQSADNNNHENVNAKYESDKNNCYFINIEQSKNEIYTDEFVDVEVLFYNANYFDELYRKNIIYPTSAWVESTLTKYDSVKDVIINNIRYKKSNLIKDRIYISKPGRYIIEPYQYDFIGFTSNDDFSSKIKFVLKTKPIEIKVKSLPPNKPRGYNGAVGYFNLTSELNNTKIKKNEASTLKIILEGEGNFYNINDLNLIIPDSIEKYSAKSNVISNDNKNIKKEWDIILVPQKAGKYSVKVDDFSFFDINTKDYKIIDGKTYQINVIENDKKEIIRDDSLDNDKKLNDESKIIQKDIIKKEINYIKLNYGLKNNIKSYNMWFSFIILMYSLLLLIIVIFVFYRLFFIKIFDGIIGSNPKNAYKKFIIHSNKLKNNFNINNIDKSIDELSDMIEKYFSIKFNIKSIEYTKNSLEKRLKDFLNEANYKRFNDFNKKMNIVRFGGDNISSDEFLKLADSIIDFIKSVENSKKAL